MIKNGILVLILSGFLVACAPEQPSDIKSDSNNTSQPGTTQPDGDQDTSQVDEIVGTDIQIAEGAREYQNSCADCHGDSGQGTVFGGPLNTLDECPSCETVAGLIDNIAQTMPLVDPGSCVGECAETIGFFIRSSWYGAQGDNSEPVDEGGNSEPVDEGGNSEPGDEGGNSEPGDEDGNSEPGDEGGNSEPGDQGENSEPGDQGGNSEPGDQGGNSDAELVGAEAQIAEGAKEYQNNCAGCHGESGQGTGLGEALNNLDDCPSCETVAGLIEKISQTMPSLDPTSCVDECAENIGLFIRSSWYRTQVDSAKYILKSREETLQEFAVNIVNRVPTAEEYERAKTEEGFDEVALSLMEEDSFGHWVILAFNDLLLTNSAKPKQLTRQFNSGYGGQRLPQQVRELVSTYSTRNKGVDLLKENFRPDDRCWNTSDLARGVDYSNNIFDYTIDKEPLQLIRYIAMNDLSTDLILTAPFTVANAYGLNLYPMEPYNVVDGDFDDFNFEKKFVESQEDLQHVPCRAYLIQSHNIEYPAAYYDPESFQPAVIPYTAYLKNDAAGENDRSKVGYYFDKEVGYPHAGILTTPAFLERYQTNNTNKNRERASLVLKYFLDIDVGASQVDNFESEEYENPVLEDPNCTACHNILDPVASTFQNFQDRHRIYYNKRLFRQINKVGSGSNYHPWNSIAGSLRQAGFASSFELANQPTGWEMPEEFTNNALQWLGQQIVAQERMYGAALIRTLYSALIAPYDNPEYFREMYDTFVAEGVDTKNIKQLVLAIIKHQDYRIDGVISADIDQHSIRSIRFLGPEMLNRKNIGILGFRWRMLDSQDAIVLYGGIDSLQTTDRLEDISGVSEAMSESMASELACYATGEDFTRPLNERLLFPYVQQSFVPDTHENEIKQNIVHLHAWFLNEELLLNDEEVQHTYDLFVAAHTALKDSDDKTLKKGVAGVRGGGPGCDGYVINSVDPVRGGYRTRSGRLQSDQHYTVKAWMAVVNYLMLDPRYIHD